MHIAARGWHSLSQSWHLDSLFVILRTTFFAFKRPVIVVSCVGYKIAACTHPERIQKTCIPRLIVCFRCQHARIAVHPDSIGSVAKYAFTLICCHGVPPYTLCTKKHENGLSHELFCCNSRISKIPLLHLCRLEALSLCFRFSTLSRNNSRKQLPWYPHYDKIYIFWLNPRLLQRLMFWAIGEYQLCHTNFRVLFWESYRTLQTKSSAII